MSDKVVVIRGELNWAKVLGKARPYTGNPKYDKGPYWSVDVTPDKASRALIKKFDFAEKLREPREKDIQKESYLSLKVLENRADGDKNNPPKVVNVRNEPWGDALLGNGTIADVKVKVKDYGSGSEKGVYLQAIRVLKHVPYEAETFEALSEDDEFFANEEDEFASDAEDTPSEAADEDLDDDVPY